MLKEHILAEIRRTANENEGSPLGRVRFAEATGIREADWSGKYWARWGDAVREAGFIPNALQAAFTDEHLLEHYAALVQALGRMPTAPELRMHASQNTGFPSHNTFARFGTRAQLLARLAEFVKGQSERSVVTELAAREVAPDSELNELVELSEKQFGFVYLIRAGKHYKLGRTNALGRRERELAIQLPERAVTVHSIRTDDPVGIEAYWHRRFSAKRKNGEWFDLDVKEIAAFRRRKFM